MQGQSQQDDLRYDLEKQFEKQISDFTKYGTLQEYTLPIVFHVVQSPGMPKITEQQIQSQLEALNRDFNTSQIINDHQNDPNGIYSERAGKPLIQFCVPVVDQEGNPTSGIVAATTSKKQWTTRNEMKSVASPWSTQKYINVWITDLEGQNAGYAQMPGGDPTLDGIVIDFQYFGQEGTAIFPYNEGKTLTHLIGNYLGLYSLWGEMECGDDRVDDTPIHNSPNFTCPEFDHVSTCDGYPTEMTINFMDATYDACRNMFTNGQIKRMQAILAADGIRSRLSQTETKCGKPEVVVAEATQSEEETPDITPTLSQIQLTPNPASDLVTINFKEVITTTCIDLRVIDINGKVILDEQINHDATQHKLDVRTLVPGAYFLNFRFEDQSVTEPLIVI